MTLNRREMLRLGTLGAAGAILSTSASSQILPSIIIRRGRPVTRWRRHSAGFGAAGRSDRARRHRSAAVRPCQGGARPAPDLSARHHRNRRFLAAVERRAVPRRRPRQRQVESHRVCHGRGSDPAHSGYLERFSNDFGSYATSKGTYVTGDYYQGKYGLSLRVRGLDYSNSNAEPRAIVIHNAWYAEDDMIPLHGQLGRSEGCFAMSRKSQYEVMRRLAGGRMIYADKLA